MLHIYPVVIFSFAKVLPKDQAEIQKLNKEVELLRVSKYSINAIQLCGYSLNTSAQSILSIVLSQSQVSRMYVLSMEASQCSKCLYSFV